MFDVLHIMPFLQKVSLSISFGVLLLWSRLSRGRATLSNCYCQTLNDVNFINCATALHRLARRLSEQHKVNPVTSQPMKFKDLVRLNMSKNADGKWHCPVTFKVCLCGV